MKTTAMQELINWLYNMEEEDIDIIELIEKVDSLLDKERDQIVDAWVDGVESEPLSRVLGEVYYNKTYGLPFNPNLN